MFSAGRLLALTILGAIATIALSIINQFFPPQKSGWLYLIAAFFMITMGTVIILGALYVAFFCRRNSNFACSIRAFQWGGSYPFWI